jgi:hypothetical protein
MPVSDALMVVSLPLLLVWLLVARLVSMFVPLLVIPSVLTAKKFYWCIPMAKDIWSEQGSMLKGFLMRIGFEATYCMNVYRRYLTIPLRKNLPDVYILGFPKCGTTAMASYLMKHPAVRGLDGLKWDATLSKETHFFSGILGRCTTGSKRLYQSFFPSIVERWWCEKVQGHGKMICMDACPLNACLPYSADRIKMWTPDAKLIFMLRDPVDASFSGEVMLTNAGMKLDWTLSEETETAKHPQIEDNPKTEQYWDQLKGISMEDPLPEDMPTRIYTDPSSVLHFSKFSERIKPFLEKFPRENIKFVDLSMLKDDQVESTVNDVLKFIGADPGTYTFEKVSMWSGERKGRQVDPVLRAKMDEYFLPYNKELCDMTGLDLDWARTGHTSNV